MQRYTVYFILKLLYMFRMVPPPIIRSANNYIYSTWYLSHSYCYLPLLWKSWNCNSNSSTSGICHTVTAICRYRGKVGTAVPTLPWQWQVAVMVWQIPDAVGTVVCAPYDGWRYHPKHVEHFSDKINGVSFHLVGYILKYLPDVPHSFLLCFILSLILIVFPFVTFS
jgi:hypothetical protein